MRYALTLSTPPLIEPVTLGEAKDHLKVDPDITEDDVLIEAMIVSAREVAESQLNRQLITQTWTASFDTDGWGWGGSWGSSAFAGMSTFSGIYSYSGSDGGILTIPLSPVQAVLSVNYYDQTGAPITMDPTLYETDLAAVRPRLRPLWGTSWPAMATRLNGLSIQVRVGYGDTANDVPRAIRQWILAAVTALYENRTLTVIAPRVVLVENKFLDGLLDRYRIVEI